MKKTFWGSLKASVSEVLGRSGENATKENSDEGWKDEIVCSSSFEAWVGVEKHVRSFVQFSGATMIGSNDGGFRMMEEFGSLFHKGRSIGLSWRPYPGNNGAGDLPIFRLRRISTGRAAFFIPIYRENSDLLGRG